jgi:hypothetical protein
MVGSDMLERSRGGRIEGAHGDWKQLTIMMAGGGSK